MALAPLPPWLNVSPSDFLNATKAGSTLREERLGRETQAAVAAADRDARMQAANADRALRAFEFEQRLQQEAAQLAAQREQAAAQLASTESWRMGGLANEAAQLAAQKAHWNVLEQQGKDRAGLSKYMNIGGNLVEIKPGEAPNVVNLGLTNPQVAKDLAKVDAWAEGARRSVELSDDAQAAKDAKLFQIDLMRQRDRNGVLVKHGQRSTVATGIGQPDVLSPAAGTPAGPGPTAAAAVTPTVLPGRKILTPELAAWYLDKTQGDRALAEQLARDQGFVW